MYRFRKRAKTETYRSESRTLFWLHLSSVFREAEESAPLLYRDNRHSVYWSVQIGSATILPMTNRR
jgi:hypothetical protein